MVRALCICCGKSAGSLTSRRDRRRTLRYRSLVIKQMVQMKNRVSGLLMETGVSYNKQRRHKVGYFAKLMTANEDVHESIRPLLKLSREMISRSQKLDYALVSSLERDPLLNERLRRLRTLRMSAKLPSRSFGKQQTISEVIKETFRPLWRVKQPNDDPNVYPHIPTVKTGPLRALMARSIYRRPWVSRQWLCIVV